VPEPEPFYPEDDAYGPQSEPEPVIYDNWAPAEEDFWIEPEPAPEPDWWRWDE
jgi:hypothetical protein